MLDDISFLVQETFKEVEKNRKAGNLFGQFFQSKENLPEEDSAGVLFHIQKNSATFVVRIHASSDLRNDYLAALKHPDLYPTLRFEEEDNVKDSLCYFECDSINIAKTIKERLGNKRFPIFEEQVFNISDPGDSWWLKKDGKKLSIFFKLSHTERMANLIKLGPLGDAEKNMDIFSKLYGYFQMLFPVEDYSSAFGQFSMSPKNEDDVIFNEIVSILSHGEMSFEFLEKLRNLEVLHGHEAYAEDLKQANYFLIELAQLRRFWKEIQSLL